MPVAIVTRQSQLFPLTHAQVDANFLNLAAGVDTAQTTADEALAAGTQYTNLFQSATGGRIRVGVADDLTSLFQVDGSAMIKGQVSMGGAVGAESLRVVAGVSQVNRVQATGGVTGVAPRIDFTGSDANVTGGIFSKGTSPINIGTNGGTTVARFVDAVNGINRLQFSGSATNIPVSIVARGTDTDVSMSLNTNGAGQFFFTTGGQSLINQFGVKHTANAVDNIDVTGAVAGVSPSFSNPGTAPIAVVGSKTWQGFSNASLAVGATVPNAASATGAAVVLGSLNGNAPYIGTSPHSTSIVPALGVRTNGVLQAQFSHVASASNIIRIQGATTTNAPAIVADGTDTNVNLNLFSKAAGAVVIGTGGGNQAVIANVVGAQNFMQFQGAVPGNGPVISAQGVDTNINLIHAAKNSGSNIFQSNGAIQATIGGPAAAVNFWQMIGNVTTGGVFLSATGSDTNVFAAYTAKGAGAHTFFTDAGSSIAGRFSHVANSINYPQFSGGAAGASPSISAVGTDVNLDLLLVSKGTGNVRFGTFSANADAPVNGYITIKDAAGNLRKLATIA